MSKVSKPSRLKAAPSSEAAPFWLLLENLWNAK
jgi:hypothetical protein